MFDEKLYFEHLKAKKLGKKLKTFNALPSTNSLIMGEGWCEGGVVVAETQTAGRGRSGKNWVSGSGGAFFSIALPLPHKRMLMPLNALIGFAVVDVLRKIVPAQLKWPNDCVCGGKKICGILLETLFTGPQLEKLAVGIGVNLFNECLPKDTNIPATCLEALGVPKNRIFKEIIVAEIVTQIEVLIEKLFLGDFEVDKIWSGYSAHINREISVTINGEKMKYIETGVDKSGLLQCVDAHGKKITITAGEVGYDFGD